MNIMDTDIPQLKSSYTYVSEKEKSYIYKENNAHSSDLTSTYSLTTTLPI